MPLLSSFLRFDRKRSELGPPLITKARSAPDIVHNPRSSKINTHKNRTNKEKKEIIETLSITTEVGILKNCILRKRLPLLGYKGIYLLIYDFDC